MDDATRSTDLRLSAGGIRTVLISDGAVTDPARLRDAIEKVPVPRELAGTAR
jgi:hypothetical protein